MKICQQRKIKHIFIKLFEPLAAIMFMIALLLGSNFFITPQTYAENENKYVLKNINYVIEGDYGIMSAYDNNLCFDIEGGLKQENKVSLIVFSKHNASNQKFTFHAVNSDKEKYIYSLSPTYTNQYMVDVDSCSSDDGAKIQLYTSNNTNAQKFVIKEVYEKIGSEEKYIGYMIFTAASNFNKALSYDGNNKIIQTSIDLNNINMKQVWFLDKGFSGYSYKNSGYYEIDKVPGVYNAINYDTGNYAGGVYYNMDFWTKYEDFLSVNQTSSWKPQNARMTQNGYTLFDSAELNISINNILGELYYKTVFKKHWINVDYDQSNLVNDKYIGGTVGRGCVEVEFTDTNNKSFSVFTTNVFDNSTYTLNYNTQSGHHTFNKVGKYAIRVYYKVKADYVTYVMKEFEFYIGSSSSRCDALMSTEEMGTEHQDKDKEKVLSSYRFSVDSNNKIKISYDGIEEYRANDEELINYITNSYYVSEEQRQENINKLIEQIKSFKEYKIFFTNTAFYMSSGGNDLAQIVIVESGFDKTNSDVVLRQTKSFVADGIYEFISSNQYTFGVKNYYRVLLQSEPNKQVFRNVTYCYKDEDGKLINYAIDYAFLEDLKIFPYTMTLDITYENITNPSNICEPIEYKSNSIIYNTTKEVLKLKFVIRDISGNKTTVYLDIFPSIPPTLNKKNLQNASYEYNYVSSGYSIRLYDGKQKIYKDYLFSTKEVALQNFLANIIENQDICKREGDGYKLSFNPYGTSFDVLEFASNEQLIEYLYELFENNVYETVLSSGEAKDYQVPEKAMHFDTLYLSKDFYFSTDKTFPLFESYKIYFTYYNSDGKLLKEGVITYNGDYRYGDSMFHILASDHEENWCDGYVDFIEYNISSNKGNEYTAYIVNANSKITLRERQGTKYEKKQYSDFADLSCEEFSIANAPNEGTTYVIEYKGERTIQNTHTFNEVKFNKAGDYKIIIENTHGFKFQISIKVYSLSAFVDGVENYGSTENDVKFRSDNLDFKYYVNGKLQSNENYELIDGEYVFTFKKSIEDQNIYIVKNYMQFACVIKGDQEFDVSPFYSNEDAYATPNSVREFRRNIQNDIASINNHVFDMKNALNDFESISEFDMSDIQSKKYDYYLSVNNNYNLIIENEELYLNKLLNSQNVLLKQNKNYKDIYVLKELFDEFHEKTEKFNKDFLNYGCKYFDQIAIPLPINQLNEILLLSERQILNMYNEYQKLSPSFDEKEFLVLDINKQLKNTIEANNIYQKEIEFIVNNYRKVDRLEKLLNESKKLVNFENTLNANILKLKRQLENISFDGIPNLFLVDNIARISSQKQEGLNLISSAYKVDLTKTKTSLKKYILTTTRQINQEYTSHIEKTEKSLQANIDTINRIQSQKEWWKIFSNIKRDKMIKKARNNIQNLYSEHLRFVESKESNLIYVKYCLEKAAANYPNIVGKDLVDSLGETLTSLRNLADKFSREAL